MAFFEGVDDEDPGRSDLASEIGANGRKFALERWAAGDVQAYMLLLLLEYSVSLPRHSYRPVVTQRADHFGTLILHRER